MSCPIAKAERSKAKDARQQPPPEPARYRTKNKRPRPWTIEHRSSFFARKGEMTKWYVTGRYRTEAERNTALEQLQRKYAHMQGSSWRMEYRAGPNPKEKS